MIDKSYTEKQWQKRLTPEHFRVCREKGTEPAFTGKYEQCKKRGVYHCVCCDNALFDSQTKYDSGSGWPSFWDIISADGIEKIVVGSIIVEDDKVLLLRRRAGEFI